MLPRLSSEPFTNSELSYILEPSKDSMFLSCHRSLHLWDGFLCLEEVWFTDLAWHFDLLMVPSRDSWAPCPIVNDQFLEIANKLRRVLPFLRRARMRSLQLPVIVRRSSKGGRVLINLSCLEMRIEKGELLWSYLRFKSKLRPSSCLVPGAWRWWYFRWWPRGCIRLVKKHVLLRLLSLKRHLQDLALIGSR